MTHRHHETCTAALRWIVALLKGRASGLAVGLGWTSVGVIDVVRIRIRLVRIVITHEAIVFLNIGANCRAGKAPRVGFDQAAEL